MPKIRVLIADDHIYAVEGLQRILSEAEDMDCVGCTNELLELPGLVRQKTPDVLVLDVAWLGDKHAGINIIPKIRKLHSKIKIISITVYPEMFELARRAGAFPLSKGFSRNELLNAIRLASQQTESPLNVPNPME